MADDASPEELETLHTLDELFTRSRGWFKSKEYLEILQFISRLRKYSAYNAVLLRIQNPDVRYVATVQDWQERHERTVNANARPLIILAPFQPVMFVYDVADTEGPDLPRKVLEDFWAEGPEVETRWGLLFNSARFMGIDVVLAEKNNSHAGSAKRLSSARPNPYGPRSFRFEVTINNKHDRAVQFATLAHELAHIICGHIGADPVPEGNWDDRRPIGHTQREIEAESVSYIVCKRLGIKSNSEVYLSNYVNKHEHIVPFSFHTVLTVAGKIEKMATSKMIGVKRSKKSGEGQMSLLDPLL